MPLSGGFTTLDANGKIKVAATGATGGIGPTGVNGTNGRDGLNGTDGEDGVDGLPGAPGVSNNGSTSKLVQVVNVQTGAVATGTTVIPLDDTVPQITEGNEYMTLAITPTSAANMLKIEVVVLLAHSVANTWLSAVLFQNSTANALAVSVQTNPSLEGNTTLHFTHYMTAGTTSATTFRVRCGGNGVGTVTFNGRVSARLYGGIVASGITISEIIP